MMKRLIIATLVTALALAAACVHVTSPAAAEAPRITVEEAKKLLGDPGAVIIDVRYGKDWRESDRKIAGAVREDPGDLKGWAGNYPKDKTLILYCA